VCADIRMVCSSSHSAPHSPRHFNHDALDLGELLQGIHAFMPRWSDCTLSTAATSAKGTPMPARTSPHGQPRARRGRCSGQRAPCASPPAGHVAFDASLTVDVHAIGRRQSGREARHFGDVGQHARGGGLAIGAGDARDRTLEAHLEETTCRSQGPPHRAACPRSAPRACENRAPHSPRKFRRPRLVALRDIGAQKIHAPTSSPMALPLGPPCRDCRDG